jgi:FkbM family methyltransferase
MLKNFVRQILFRDSSRRVLCSQRMQPIWERLHKLSLYGMNYGGGNVVEQSGELWVLEWLERRHAAARSGTPALIFDVGAHDGSYALSASRIFGTNVRIHSFEPAEAVYQTLLRATASQPNITVHHCGLSDREGTATLYYDGVGSQKASVHVDAHINGLDRAAGAFMAEEVRLRTVDAFCEEQGISRISMLKIDVEGNELNVLRGSTRMIEAGAIGAIQFEFGEAQIGSLTFFKNIYQFLSPRYRVHRILRMGLSNAFETYDVILEVYRTTNYLAVLRDQPTGSEEAQPDGRRPG